MTTGRWQVSGPHVVHDEIDGEVVVINFTTGSYYSLLGSAVPVWALFRTGATAQDAVAVLEVGYATDGIDLMAAVSAFIAQLEAEGLVAPAPDDPDAPSVVPPAVAGTPAPYVAPALEKFTDMEDLILLDPVHDVSQAGWPNAPQGDQPAAGG